ncbi:hypothetical protein [Burkholderia sp. Bp8998]|uniref:hypothetical protein n=1 Tax=Burkholderia sp. Bp8998 TaxID=2184557 RepID=UPI00163AFB82|nr:hypothetical protein [Burkholderia sp. Bp8998]
MSSSRSMPVRALLPSGQTRTCEVQMRIVRAIRPIDRRTAGTAFRRSRKSCPIGQVLDDQNAQRNVFLA